MVKKIFSALLFFVCFLLPLSAGGGTEEESVTANPAGGFSWNMYSGTIIKVMVNNHPWVELIAPLLSEFEEMTGISVEITVYPENQYRAKRILEMVSGTSEIDVFMIMPDLALTQYTQPDWLYPLNDYMKSENYLWPLYDIDDFYKSSFGAATRDGKVYAVPIQVETYLLAYNRSILYEYGIDVPETMQELEEACRIVYEESNSEIYGITLRGDKASASTLWVDFLHSFGGEYPDGTGGIASPESIEATDFYGSLLRLYGPKNAENNSWNESTSIFMQGKAAFIYDAGVFKSIYEDSEKSSIAGNIGYTVIPEGPAGSVPHISEWGLAIYSGSENKEAAWLFIQWATSKEMALKGLMHGIPSARNSAWESPEYSGSDTSPEWTQACIKSYKLASGLVYPPVITADEYRDAIGAAIVASILGEDVESACRNAAEIIKEIIGTTD